VLVAGRDRHVLAEAERVVLIDPGVVRRLAAAVIGYAAKLRAGQTIECPALGAVLAGRGRAVERAFAFAPVEGAEMAARERRPGDALAVDVAAARRVARQRHFVDLGERGLGWVRARIDPHNRARIAGHGAPDRAIGRRR